MKITILSVYVLNIGTYFKFLFLSNNVFYHKIFFICYSKNMKYLLYNYLKCELFNILYEKIYKDHINL